MPRNLALLVGVDRYPNLPKENQLRSCANDARLMARVLGERFGFGEEGLRLLIDQDATQEKILAALGELAAQARKGDAVVFYFSGHGSQAPDAEGDEPSGMDQTIVPHDSGRHGPPNRDITDDVIHEWVLKVSSVTTNLTVIADTCYSGTITREPREKWIEADDRIPEGLGGVRSTPRRRDAKPSGLLPVSERYVLLAACRVSERAKELPDRPNSAFTWFLCKELLQAPAEATYREVIEKTRDAVAAAVQAQTPQAEGARDRRLFGLERNRVTLPADGVATRARYAELSNLADEDEANPLRGCLEARFLRRSADGSFRAARPEKTTGEIVYDEGDLLALRVTNRSDKPLHIHVLDLGLAGGIGLLHPVDGANDPLGPGRSLDIGVRNGQRFRLRIPEGFEGREGKESVKILATIDEADFSWLKQSGFEDRPSEGPPGGLRAQLAEGTGWTVATVGFVVRRRG